MHFREEVEILLFNAEQIVNTQFSLRVREKQTFYFLSKI